MKEPFKIENAKHYSERQKMAIKIINGEATVEDALKRIRRIARGSSENK